MATYNGERYLAEQLKSILGQTLEADEIVVVDDASTDGTREILDDFVRRCPGRLTVMAHEINMGPKAAFARGIQQARGDFIALSDQDDIWRQEKLKRLFSKISGAPNAGLCFHDLEMVNKDGDPRAASFWKSAPKSQCLPVVGMDARNRIAGFSNPVPGCTMFFDARLKGVILPMPESPHVGHDWWISAVAFFSADPVYVSEPLIRYRLHPGQAAGIGTFIKKKKDERDILPVRRRIAQEIRRVFVGRRLKAEKYRAEMQSRMDKTAALLQLVRRCRKEGRFPERFGEYSKRIEAFEKIMATDPAERTV